MALTGEPAAAVGDSVALRVPVAPGASSSGVTALPPLMSVPLLCRSNSPAWFVVFLTVAVIGRLEPESMVVDVDVGRPVSVTGASWLYAPTPGTAGGDSV